MKTYIIGVWDKFTKWLIDIYEVEADSKKEAKKFFENNVENANTYIIKIVKKK